MCVVCPIQLLENHAADHRVSDRNTAGVGEVRGEGDAVNRDRHNGVAGRDQCRVHDGGVRNDRQFGFQL